MPLTANATAGKALFSQIHCDACHTPALPTSPNFIPVSDLALVTNHVITALSNKSARLYSDLLLHNMGALADGIAQAAANTNQMRTAPLWGLRESQPYLHDGRALTGGCRHPRPRRRRRDFRHALREPFHQPAGASGGISELTVTLRRVPELAAGTRSLIRRKVKTCDCNANEII